MDVILQISQEPAIEIHRKLPQNPRKKIQVHKKTPKRFRLSFCPEPGFQNCCHLLTVKPLESNSVAHIRYVTQARSQAIVRKERKDVISIGVVEGYTLSPLYHKRG